MIRPKRVVVGLDFTEMDLSLIGYTKFIHALFDFDEIHFLHVIPKYLDLDNFSSELQELYGHVKPIDNRIEQELEEKVKRVFYQEPSCKVFIEIRKGSAYRELMKEVEAKSADLLLVGKKERSTTPITPSRLAHNADCNVLFVPDRAKSSARSILVPTDLSKSSANALSTAKHIARQDGGSEITALHVVRRLPAHYYYGLERNDAFCRTLIQDAEKAYGMMLEDAQLDQADYTEVHIEDDYGNVANKIHQFALENKFDIIVMNAKRHSRVDNILVGSVAERFVNYCREIPVLLLRGSE